MADRLGITNYPVNVTPVGGAALSKLRNRLAVMEREVEHLRTAVKDMQNGVARADNRLLTSGVMNSRNWTLSVVMSLLLKSNLTPTSFCSMTRACISSNDTSTSYQKHVHLRRDVSFYVLTRTFLLERRGLTALCHGHS